MNAVSKGMDEKFCSECAAIIKVKAVICPKCGCPQTAAFTPQAVAQQKNKNTAGLVAMLLGGLGIHKFYLGRPTQGFFYMIFFWTFIPALLGLVDAIKLFGMSADEFNRTYNSAD